MDEPQGPRAILIVAPFGRDAELLRDLLHGASFPAEVRSSVFALDAEVHEGGPLLIAEEALTPAAMTVLLGALERQPEWSDLPIGVLIHGKETARSAELRAGFGIANVTYIERPMRPTTLVSAVRALMRARARQFEIRDLLVAYAEATEAEREARAAAERALQAREEFLGIASHELRTPLTIVLGNVDFLRRRQQEARLLSPEFLQETVDEISRQALRLAALVDDLLDTSRIQQGRLLLDPMPMSLNALLFEVAERAARDPNITPDHRLIVAGSEQDIIGVWDKERLDQVVTNLVSNAIKYSPAGGTVTLAVRYDDNEAVLSVSDEGIGIAEAQIPRLFEPFTRLHDPRTLVNGTGLGLYIADQLVRMHNGSITVRSAPQVGTIFSVRLPLQVDKDEPAALTPEVSASSAPTVA